jgi:hypothetical protein
MLYMAMLTAGPAEAQAIRNVEHRVGERRTGVDRRCLPDRRADRLAARETPATYSNQEARTIKAAILESERPTCPRCHGFLCIGPAIPMLGGDRVREVRCKACRRSVMVRRGFLNHPAIGGPHH